MGQSAIFMYSGQGSQYYHMAKVLFETNEVFRKEMKYLNNLVFEFTDESVLDVLYDPFKGLNHSFKRTLYTHISIFMVECALTNVLIHNGIKPVAVFGTSLGEFAAGVTAGIWDKETALRAVVKQAQLLEKHCVAGGMLAILYDYSLYSTIEEIHGVCELAAVNYRNHFVVSGTEENISKVVCYVKSKGITSQQLPVVHGFHSSAIDPIADPYLAFLNEVDCRNPQIPYVSCVRGETINRIDPHHFWNVARDPICFSEAAKTLLEKEKGLFLDLGPSGTTLNLLKKAALWSNEQVGLAILTPYHQEIKQLNKIMELCE